MGNKLKTVVLWLLIFSIPLQLGKHFWPNWSYVWGMKVDYLSPVFYLSDIFLLTCIFLNWKEIVGQINFKINWKKIVLLLFFVSLNCFFARVPLVALTKWARVIALIGFYFLVKVQKKKVEKVLKTVIPVWIVGLFLVSLLQAISQSSLGGVFWWLGERSFNVNTPGIAKTFLFGRFYLRPYAIFSHPNSLAGFLVVSVVAYLALGKSPAVKKIVLVLGSLTVGLTLSRSAVIAGMVLLIFQFIKKKNWIFVILAILFLGFVFTGSGFDLSFSRRISLALASLDIFASSPIIGVGLNSFIIALPSFWRQDLWLQPVHNIFLLVLSETGLIGFFVFVKLIFKTFFGGKYLPAFLLIMITGLFDHYWLTLIQNLLLFVLVVGLAENEN